MSWLSSPRVRLALIVNGLYFISLATPTAPHRRPRLFPPAQEPYAVRAEEKPAPAAEKKPFVLPPLPPPSVPLKATSFVSKEFNQLDVYLTQDLTLVDRPDHRLLLAPTFTTKASKPEMPDSVLLRFISYSSERTLTGTTTVTITADGRNLINERSHYLYNGHDAPPTDGVPVIEGMGVELPYDLFIDLTNARRVTVQLGADWVELPADQLEALRDMRRRLPPPTRPHGTGNAPVVN